MKHSSQPLLGSLLAAVSASTAVEQGLETLFLGFLKTERSNPEGKFQKFGGDNRITKHWGLISDPY